MKHVITYLFFYLFSNGSFSNGIINIYAWADEIPKKVLQQFEHENGIKVNLSTYDSNETMYAKLKASNHSIYDVILPSSYFVERMQKQNMLAKLDHKKLPNLPNLEPRFSKNEYDPGNLYSVPLTWGSTGIFYNKHWVKKPPTTWQQLWEKRWRGQLMLLDDPRDVFFAALISMGYQPNDTNPIHIRDAYRKLLTLIPNIKLFASEGIQAIMIDEDAIAGSTWSGDAYKANAENSQIDFIYPQEGFIIWIDCLAIPINPPHAKEAYQFINFLLKANISAQVGIAGNYAITNKKGKSQLPPSMLNNPMIYPSSETLKRSYIQRDLGEKAITLYNKYWEQLKLAF